MGTKPRNAKGRAASNGKTLELFARCAAGFEKVCAQELKDLGLARVRPLKGGVSFFGSQRDAYVACLWSRVATRVQLVIARVEARDANELYHGCSRIPWERHIPMGATIAVEAHGTNKSLRNTKFTALKVKDALCDCLRKASGQRPNVNTHNPTVAINVALHEQKATLYLNLSGESLHRRGYRKDGEQSAAPLKETLAAGMLLLAGWDALANEDAAFVDPLCGSGTLAIEATLIASHTAPGLLRKRWGFLGWSQHNQNLWDEVLQDAQAAVRFPEGAPRISASDIDKGVLELARQNAQRAGVGNWVRFFADDACNLGKHLRGAWAQGPGLMAANPPYGIRLLSPTTLHQAYASLAEAAQALPNGWRICVITPDAGIDSSLGRLPSTCVSCYNGPIPTWIRVYDTTEPHRVHELVSLDGVRLGVPIALPNSVQFAARLRKVARERARWSQKNGVESYRIYDADLPEYAFSLDLYTPVDKGEDNERRYVRIAEHRRTRAIDSQLAMQRLADSSSLAAAILGIPLDHVLVCPWQNKEAGHTQSSEESRMYVRVREDRLVATIDLARPDQTLPLDQRELRQFVAQHASHKRVAALFSPTTPLLVRAALANATGCTLVDASPRHLKEAQSLIRQNKAAARSCKTVRDDPRKWIDHEIAARQSYDLVLCVAPEWRGAKDAGGSEWDCSRDHVALLSLASKLLTPKGMLVFVCPDPQVKLRIHEIEALGMQVHDMSAQMLPPDFKRSRNTTRIAVLERR